MREFRTVGARLSVALLLVVACVLASVYLVVVPSLRDRLVGSRQRQTARVADRISDQWKAAQPPVPEFLAETFSSATNTCVTIFTVSNRSPLLLVDIA